jgi:hypothetical protein
MEVGKASLSEQREEYNVKYQILINDPPETVLSLNWLKRIHYLIYN